MELYLQLGYGMMELSRQLLQTWGRGTVILSPRDLKPNQLLNFSKNLRQLGGAVLLDPQFYLPHADYTRLRMHDYWPGEYESMAFWSGAGITRLLGKIFELNKALGCETILLPGLYAAAVDEDWLWRQEELAKGAQALHEGRFRLFATIALGEEVARDQEQMDTILDAVPRWGVDGIYLVCEHPRGDYFVKEPVWLANVMNLIAGLRLQGRQVILGYCQQQMLIAACASANAIASGTWMNVRCFPPEKFRIPEEEEPKNATTWYYCPPALSEFKIPMLDTALRQGVLSELATPQHLGSTYAYRLFSGPPPSSVGFTNTEAFRHYLQCLHGQVASARLSSFEATADDHKRTLDRAAEILNRVHAVKVYGSNRDFGEFVEVNHAALNILERDSGPMLRRQWQQL